MVAIMEFIRLDAHVPVPVRGRYTYYPDGAAPQTPVGINGGRFFQVLVEIEITGDAQGVICSQRSRCGGYSLFMTSLVGTSVSRTGRKGMTVAATSLYVDRAFNGTKRTV